MTKATGAVNLGTKEADGMMFAVVNGKSQHQQIQMPMGPSTFKRSSYLKKKQHFPLTLKKSKTLKKATL